MTGAVVTRLPGGQLVGRQRERRLLDELLADEPEEIQDKILRINTDARPLALQVALLIPILAGLVGLFNAFRMMRLPDPEPSGAATSGCGTRV